MHKVGDKLVIKKDDLPLVKVQSFAYKMDNILGSDGFNEGDVLSIAYIDGDDVFMTYQDKIYFIKMKDIEDDIILNVREQRREKLNKIFDNE